MYVEDQPDLGDECFGRPSYQDDDYYEPYYKYQFDSTEALIQSVVFQQQLSKALQFKDKQIRELQDELMKYSKSVI